MSAPARPFAPMEYRIAVIARVREAGAEDRGERGGTLTDAEQDAIEDGFYDRLSVEECAVFILAGREGQ